MHFELAFGVLNIIHIDRNCPTFTFSHLQGPEEQFDKYGGAWSLPRSAGIEETVSMMKPLFEPLRQVLQYSGEMYWQNGLKQLFDRQAFTLTLKQRDTDNGSCWLRPQIFAGFYIIARGHIKWMCYMK